jgi:phage tail sheath gpL-like
MARAGRGVMLEPLMIAADLALILQGEKPGHTSLGSTMDITDVTDLDGVITLMIDGQPFKITVTPATEAEVRDAGDEAKDRAEKAELDTGW